MVDADLDLHKRQKQRRNASRHSRCPGMDASPQQQCRAITSTESSDGVSGLTSVFCVLIRMMISVSLLRSRSNLA